MIWKTNLLEAGKLRIDEGLNLWWVQCRRMPRNLFGDGNSDTLHRFGFEWATSCFSVVSLVLGLLFPELQVCVSWSRSLPSTYIIVGTTYPSPQLFLCGFESVSFHFSWQHTHCLFFSVNDKLFKIYFYVRYDPSAWMFFERQSTNSVPAM